MDFIRPSAVGEPGFDAAHHHYFLEIGLIDLKRDKAMDTTSRMIEPNLVAKWLSWAPYRLNQADQDH
jgi:hypothetical protein